MEVMRSSDCRYLAWLKDSVLSVEITPGAEEMKQTSQSQVFSLLDSEF